MSKPTISKHLSILESAGLIWRHREGQFVPYGMEQEHLAGRLMPFMQEVCPSSRTLRREVKDEIAQQSHPETGGDGTPDRT